MAEALCSTRSPKERDGELSCRVKLLYVSKVEGGEGAWDAKTERDPIMK